MHWEQALLFYPLLFAALVSVATAVGFVVRTPNQRLRTDARWFVVLAVSVGLWAAGTAFAVTATTGEGTFGGAAIAWLGVSATAIAWPLFVAAYTNRRRWLRASRVLGVAVIPAVSYFAALTNPVHGLFVIGLDTATGSDLGTVVAEPGPVLVVFVAYTLAVDIVTLGWLASSARDATGTDRRQYRLVFVAGAVPFAASVTHLVLAPQSVDFTPVTFGVTVPLLGLTLLELHDRGLVRRAHGELLESLPDGVVVVDDAGRVADVNTAAERLFGDIVGSRFADAAADYPTLRGLEPADGAVELTAALDGEHVVFDARVAAIEDDDIRPTGHLYLLRDVTERRRTEVRYQTLLEDSAALVSVVSADGEITYASPAHESVLGHAPGDLVGESVFAFVHPEDREHAVERFERLLDDDEPDQTRIEYRFRTGDGAWRRLESSGEDFRSQPFLGGVVITSQDVTERVRDAHRLDLLNRVLRHDVRNAMNVIEGNATLIAERAESETVAERADTIKRRARSLAEMSDEARTLDHAITAIDETTCVDVSAILASCVTAVRERYPDATWTVDIEGDRWAYTDPLIGDAIEIVVERAADDADPDPAVTVKCERVTVDDEPFVEIRVVDDGRPIGDQDRRVLEHGEETTLEHGTGIRTWFVNWVVTASGGSVTVDERDDGRNAVTLRLPGTDDGDAVPDADALDADARGT
ncbi:histidine kinase N-terminal 7TM domain-containing protein [Halocalculus aciditolerans]|uniref:PAS domain S-box protein n=1 Tax=Halocalculus aciditolerans TaxID=1383812 RepID=A0A830FKH0_9EURY|nr:histidine kinase N-terminal 7TM domain-containing protein [Halocalculus aciditolerans]GGL64703.1 hypothetical protein GCM10009039_23350 [Halocalculus aciditolerans]